MKSLKDEIDESLDNFTGPMSQAFRNIRDSISDTVGDVIADSQERGEGYSRPRKKGCLWSFIKWLLILSVISALLSECGGESTVSLETNTQNTTQDTEVEITETKASYETQAVSDTTESIENTYDLLLVSARNIIDTILSGSSVDMDALQSEYEFLLSLRISEYMFKASAYGYHTGDYDVDQFDYILEESETICQEMKTYFPEDEVDSYFTEFSVWSYYSFDEEYIDYESRLIGNKKNPDIDAMWLSYVDSLVENAEFDIRSAINQHGMEMYSALLPTESVDADETEAPAQDDTYDEGHIEGYVMYGIGELNIRSGPGVAYEQVGRLPEGERVVITETQYSGTAEWGHIERGWICMDYIQTDAPIPESAGAAMSGDTFETDFFYIALPDGWNERYVLEHTYSVRSENIVFYYESTYQYYKETYSEPGGWPFAIEVRADGTDASAIAGWDYVGMISTSEGYSYELYLRYPIDPQFMDGSYNIYLEDADRIVASIVCKDGYSISLFD